MLPYIAAENGHSLSAANSFAHNWIILVRGGDDLEFAVIHNQPGPAAAEPAHTRGFEFLFEGVEAAVHTFDVVTDFAARRAARVWTNNFPKHRMVCMTTAVIAHHAFNVRRHGVQIADEIFDGFLFQVGLAGDGFIHVRHISAMM